MIVIISIIKNSKMKTYHFVPTILICLIGTLLFLSCGGQSKDTEPESTTKETANAFQQALREQVSEIKEVIIRLRNNGKNWKKKRSVWHNK